MPTQVGNLVVFGDIELKWLAIGGLSSPLRQPVTNEAPTFDDVGREQKFQGGFISWHPDVAVKAHVVWGLIGERWAAIGREKFGYPVTDESDFPGGGKYNTFRAMQLAGHPEASIVWKPGTTAAWEVYGAIRDKWISVGSVSGALGYPVQEERSLNDGGGRFQLFEGGSISWHPGTDAHVEVRHPAISLRAVADQGQFIVVEGTGFTSNQPVILGYDIASGGAPTTHQTGQDTLTSDGTGRFVHRIRVNLAGDISSAQVQATDIASNMKATASI